MIPTQQNFTFYTNGLLSNFVSHRSVALILGSQFVRNLQRSWLLHCPVKSVHTVTQYNVRIFKIDVIGKCHPSWHTPQLNDTTPNGRLLFHAEFLCHNHTWIVASLVYNELVAISATLRRPQLKQKLRNN